MVVSQSPFTGLRRTMKIDEEGGKKKKKTKPIDQKLCPD